MPDPIVGALVNDLADLGVSLFEKVLRSLLVFAFPGRRPTAFGHTFAWGAGLTALAMVPAALLARAERAERRAGQPASGGHATPAALADRSAG